MELKGSRVIAAPRAAVWAALNDPDVLGACIPGCQELTGSPEEGFAATVVQKVGPVKATFKGEVTLEDVVEGQSYRIVGEGKGGAAGFAKGGAKVNLEETTEDGAPATILTYEVNASVGGKLAAIGSRLIDSTAKKYANDFFEKFKEIASERAPGDAAAAPAAETPASDAKPAGAQTAAAAPKSAPAKKEDHAVTETADPRSEEMKRLGIPAENVYDGLHWAAALSWVALAAATVLLVVTANA